MKKKFLLLFCIPVLLTACKGTSVTSETSNPSMDSSVSISGDTSNSSVISGASSITSGSVPGSSSSSSNEKEGNEYDYWCNSWSKPGHLYVHYNRGDKNDYENFCLWIWQHAPEDLEGSLWAFSGNPQVSSKLTLKPMSTNWMSFTDVNKDGSGIYKDDYGVIVDVDLKAANLVGGKTGKPTTFEGANEIGFLMVKQDSMDGATNWTSDGGRETYVDEFGEDEYWRNVNGGKAMHLFLSTGALSKYSFFVGDGTPEVQINPIDSDSTGNYRSKVETMTDSKYGLSSTSSVFKEVGTGYQIFVASFRDSNGDGLGDIRGIIDSLDYLDDLGVKALWLTPIQQSDSYHGYDISDYYAVDKKFGTLDDYKELIYKAHQRGMKVLMDLVLNHTSKNNVWFTKSQWNVNGEGAEQDGTGINWRDVYTWKYKTDTIKVRERIKSGTGENAKYTFTGNKIDSTVEEDSRSDGPSWYKDGESNYYYYGKFGSGMPEINYENNATRELVIDMAKYWLSFGLDGFRLDAVKHIYMEDEVTPSSGDVVTIDVGDKKAYDDEKGEYAVKPYDYSSNLTKNVKWWKQFANELKAVYPNCFLVGENFDGWGTRTASYYQGLDSQFDFANYYHIPAWIFNNAGGASNFNMEASETFDTFASSSSYDLKNDADGHPFATGLVPGGSRSDFIDGAFTSNHDVMRAINQANGSGNKDGTTALDKVTGQGDQINKAKIQAAITILNPGCSWIYYGDELGMSSNIDQHIAKYENENCMDIWYRQPFLWNDTNVRPNYKSGQYKFELDSYNSSLAGVSIENKQVKTNNAMYEWYKALIDIKNNYPRGAKVTFEGSTNVLCMNVTGSGKAMKIYINVGTSTDGYILNPGNNYVVYKRLNTNANNGSQTFGNDKYSVIAFREN